MHVYQVEGSAVSMFSFADASLSGTCDRQVKGIIRSQRACARRGEMAPI
jgi:hypothetical protein